MITLKKIKAKKSFANIVSKESFITPRNDLSAYDYTRSWDQGLAVDVYGYEVLLPDMPPKEEIINYGKPKAEQIFRKTKIPDGLHYMQDDEKEAFIEREHHRRVHGLWYYIKGEPTYIPGPFYFFLNYWTVQTGKPTHFHMGDWKFFIIWMHVVLSPEIFGLLVFKCRRIGDTEKALSIVYEYASRVKNTINQLYDCRTEKDIKKTFQRMKKAHKKMPFFFKPVTKNDEASSSLEFRFSTRKTNLSNSTVGENGELNLSEYEYPEMDSEITYYTNEGGADGTRLGREYIDEFGKFNQINPEELWKLSKKALEDDREGRIIGKSLWTSTIEELSSGKTLDVAKEMWKNADPAVLNPKGQTVSGLIRIVRGALDRAETDRWGHVDEAKIMAEIKADQDFLIANKKWGDLISYKRQNCLTISDVFSNISKGSPFSLENINNRLNLLLNERPNTYVRGNFEWVDGIKPIPGNPKNVNRKCRVYFVPHDEGRWYVSYHPKDFNLVANAMDMYSNVAKPGNTLQFSTGIDPVAYRDNMEDEKKRSLSGLAVKRNLDLSIDNSEDLYNEDKSPKDGGEDFKTNRYCCVYWYRHDKPSDNYDDWLKTFVYYGSDFLIEKNHSAGFNQYLETLGFLSYYREGGSGISNYLGKQEDTGLTATEKTVEAYFGAITELIATWYNTIDIPLILEHLSTMEYETRGKHDLGVGIGFCELLSLAKQQDITRQEEYQNAESQEYMEEYVHSSD